VRARQAEERQAAQTVVASTKDSVAWDPTAARTAGAVASAPESAIAGTAELTRSTAFPPAEPGAAIAHAPSPAPVPEPAQERIHVIQPGDNLFRIGLRYGIPWTALMEHNRLPNPNAVHVGQQIRIPSL
jgi:2',3'-cyclic-nucleotide 2'-phosphodiesterase/3'-nucleotidase